MFALRSSPNHIPIKYRRPIQKTSHWRPIHLTSKTTVECWSKVRLCIGNKTYTKKLGFLSGVLLNERGELTTSYR